MEGWTGHPLEMMEDPPRFPFPGDPDCNSCEAQLLFLPIRLLYQAALLFIIFHGPFPALADHLVRNVHNDPESAVTGPYVLQGKVV